MASILLKSEISWLDFAEDDRRKMMEVLSLFKLRETRDELGLQSRTLCLAKPNVRLSREELI